MPLNWERLWKERDAERERTRQVTPARNVQAEREADSEGRTARAAARIREKLAEADAGRFGRSGSAWANYIDRKDVEIVLDAVEAGT